MVNIVLFEPEIPQNTGNIMRTCVATGIKLHLIKPLGFYIRGKKHLKRSGANYIDKLNYKVYENYEEFTNRKPRNILLLYKIWTKSHIVSFNYYK